MAGLEVCMVGVHEWQGVCMVVGACVAGECVHGRELGGGGHAWWGACMAGGMCGRRVCMAGGMADEGVCVAGGVCMAGGMHGRGRVWQSTQPTGMHSG